MQYSLLCTLLYTRTYTHALLLGEFSTRRASQKGAQPSGPSAGSTGQRAARITEGLLA